MIELKIPEVILRERRRMNLTQEELAAKLNVSPQAVSNWERGGYPDITLLPRIAGCFGITVDELIGSDAVSREADIADFKQRYGNRHGDPASLQLAKEYYQKYPQSFEVAELLAFAIHHNKDTREENYPLLREVCEKILRECTWENTRRCAIEFMCADCPDEAWEEWRVKCPQFYASVENEVLEERYFQRCNAEKYHSQVGANHLLTLTHLLGREYMRYYEKGNLPLFSMPARTAAMMAWRMRIIEQISPEGEIPEAWRGAYADLSLKRAGALIGAGALDAGFAALAQCFDLFAAWLAIPPGKPMETGPAELFGGARITKCDQSCVVNILLADGNRVWCPDLWLFWQLPGDIRHAMENWPWFDAVREDERYLALHARAQAFTGG